MALKIDTLLPGDVVATAGKGFWVGWIKLYALITGKPALVNHIVVVSHRDTQGRLWGIQAMPAGIGWVDMSKWDGKAYAVANTEQVKTDDQRARIVAAVTKLLGSPYDYGAYVVLALRTIGIELDWVDFNNDQVPVHAICSSLADYAYEDSGLDSPGGTAGTRFTTPADWHEFIELHEWEN